MAIKSTIRYVCILRGINVGGAHVIAMEDLVKVFAGLGYTNVSTYIQSGNVIFDADNAINGNDHAPRIHAALRKQFGFEVPVIVRRARQMEQVLSANPYAQGKKVEVDRLYVTFLAAHPMSSNLAELKAQECGKTEFEAIGREVYLKVPGLYSECRMTNGLIEKVLKIPATTRNWKTVSKLVELATQEV